MKRPQDSTDDTPALKKHKSSDSDMADVGGWTRVEKRKQKKVKKAEVKLDVCVCSCRPHLHGRFVILAYVHFLVR